MALRLKIVSIIYGTVVLAVLVKLFHWQIIKGSELSLQARSQQTSSEKISAHRGEILSSDGTAIASTREAWLLHANPSQVEESAKSIAETLAPIFVEQPQEASPEAQAMYKQYLSNETNRITELLSDREMVWVPIKSKLTTGVKNNIAEMNILGLNMERQEARFYPEGSAAAHLLGFVGKDDAGNDKGYFGLEGYYQLSLAGKPGFRVREANALGAPILVGSGREMSASEGVNLVTTIDKTVQLLAEKELNKGIEKYGAKAGTVIIMNPKTGGIMAMASAPSYDPEKYYNYNDELFRNPSIADSFEPGSIFKPIVMAAGIDAGVVEPSSVCDICSSAYKIDKYFIRTWNNEYHANSTMTDVLKHSDNVGMVYVGNKLGIDKLHQYLVDFGFGSQTGIDLQGEMTPVLRSRESWSVVDLATAAFGQGVAATPIQIVRAIGALANEGKILVPKVVAALSLDGWNEELPVVEGRQIISKETAEKIVGMMEVAAEDGEAKWAIPKGFRIAGKTGTAQIPVEGHYDEDKTIASFVGFAPANDPKFVMLVTLREPESSQWASETAAPLWFGIAKELFRHLNIRPEIY